MALDPSRPLRIVVSRTLLRPFVSAGQGTALALVELVSPAFIAISVIGAADMPAAPLLLFFAVVVGWALRAVDLESCALFIPGGVYGTAKEAYGARMSRVAAAALLVECLLFGALAASAAGHSLATVAALIPHLSASLRRIAVADVATTIAV